jgi:feruloyl esterase
MIETCRCRPVACAALVFGIALVHDALPLAAATPCEDLSRLAIEKAEITVAQTVAAGSFHTPDGAPVNVGVEFCRVALTLKPSSDSNIQLEVWLPNTGWNGKFQGVGNGGFAGSIGYGLLAAGVAHGYATASADTGHHGGVTDARWAVGHREKVIDFGYRAIHESAVAAKSIIRAFYGSAPKRAYFSSCSNGGRQALMEAQRYPDDYDGIIAGAPANYWTRLLSQAVVNSQATLSDSASYIPASKLPAITQAALAACDVSDGVRDGVIENPAKCRFDPSALVCKGQDTEGCLTAPQVTALQKLYTGPRSSKGEQIMPGYAPGGEAEPGGWGPWITGQAPAKSLMYAFGTQFFANMVFENPDWDFETFDLDRDLRVADEKLAADLNSADPDLRRFKARGGKLILYHGWSDAAIPGQSTINYYDTVVRKMGRNETAEFVRLYMVPGMQHCGGGSGATVFGQGIGVPTNDAQHDIAAALERWVEDGVAPREIVATKYKIPTDPGSGALRTHPLCPYPQTANYKGSGSTDDAVNFVCR